MPIPTQLSDLSTTAASNSPAATDSLSAADDNIRALASIIKRVTTGVDAMTTPNLGAATGTSLAVTGTLSMGSAFSFRNKIINGGMQVNQRGSVACTATNAYGPDRWIGSISAGTGITATFSNTANALWKTGYAALISGTWISGSALIAQRIESFNCRELVNKTVTITAKVYQDSGSSVNYTITAQYANSQDSFGGGVTLIGTSSAQPVANTTLTTLTYTVNLGANAANGIQIVISAAATSVTSKNFYFGEVQLEEGSVATPFEVRPYGLELALCQRYYYRIAPGAVSGALGYAYAISATTGAIVTTPPVPLRVTPTALEQSGTATDYRVSIAGTSTNLSAVPTFGAASTVSALQTNFSVASGLTAGQAGICLLSASVSTGYLGWSAEL